MLWLRLNVFVCFGMVVYALLVFLIDLLDVAVVCVYMLLVVFCVSLLLLDLYDGFVSVCCFVVRMFTLCVICRY